MQFPISNELLLVIAFALVLVLILVLLIPAARGKHDTPHDNEAASEHFPDKHVHLAVPWQGYAVKILRIPFPPQAELPIIKVADRDWPHDVLLNVVVARQDKPDELVTHYDPALSLKMAYSADDLKRATDAGLEYPAFGFWDGCQWVLFTKDKHNLFHEFNPKPTDDEAGFVTVQLTTWSDPAIGKGP